MVTASPGDPNRPPTMQSMKPTDPVTCAASSLQTEPGTAAELLSAIGSEELQRMQDSFAALGQVSLCIYDPFGKPLTKLSCATDFCALLAGSAAGQAACCQSEVKGVPQVTEHVTQVCHAGVVRYVAPVCLGGRQLAGIVLGDRLESAADPGTLAELSRRFDVDEHALRRAAEGMAPADRHRNEHIVRFLQVLADRLATICRQHADMTQRVRELEAVHDLTAMFAGTENLKETLTTTAERICQVMEVKACSVRMLDEDTGELRIVAGYNLSQEYLDKGPVLLGENPIDGAAFAGETIYIRDVPNDPGTRYPESARAAGLVSGLCVPMTYHGTTVGVIRIYTGHEHEFSGFQRALARSIGSQIAAAIAIQRLHEARLSAERYQYQLKSAAAIQRRMVPGERRTHAGIEFGCVYNPALNVGGDFFDFVELPKGNLGFCVADVVGKGISAALMMASVRAALRAHAHSVYNIDEIVGLVNAHMYRDTLPREFATLLYGVFSADGKQLTYCNAGHEPGLLLRGGRVMELSTGGMVIGVAADAEYARGLVDLRHGDILVAYTDGVTEALDFNDGAFGRERLIESVRTYAELDAPTLAKQLLWDVRRFVGLAPQTDDITIVVAKMK